MSNTNGKREQEGSCLLRKNKAASQGDTSTINDMLSEAEILSKATISAEDVLQLSSPTKSAYPKKY